MKHAAVAELQPVPELPQRWWAPAYHRYCAATARGARYTGTDVSTSETVGNSFADRLRDHLAPELLARLIAEGLLPPEIIAAECARLRAELAAVATYIP